MIIPSSVISIGDNFIDECVKLNTIKISSCVKKIGKLSFKNFTLLKEFIIPPCVTTIYENEFDNCSSLQKIEIPSSVIHIEQYAFNKCVTLKQITIPPSVTTIEEGIFAERESLKTINIPDSVTSIGFYAFLKCISLVNITLPSSVNKISCEAFKECNSLKRITIKNELQNIEITKDLQKELKLIFAGYTDSGKTCFVNRFLNDIFLEDMLNTIGASYVSKEADFEGKKIDIKIQDHAGKEKYKYLFPIYLSDSSATAAFFDINNQDSFNEVEYYLKYIRDHSEQISIALIGNKSDLEHKVSDADINEIAKKYNAKYIEVSVKNNYNVQEVFDYLIPGAVNLIFEREKNRIQDLICNDEKKCTIY